MTSKAAAGGDSVEGGDRNHFRFSEDQLARTVRSFADAAEDELIREAILELLDAPVGEQLRFALSDSWIFLSAAVRAPDARIAPSRTRTVSVRGTVYSTFCTYVAFKRPDGTRQDWLCRDREEERVRAVELTRSLDE